MKHCPYCQSSNRQVKNGFNASGSQCYKCKCCNRRYTPVPNKQGYPKMIRERALGLHGEGLSFRHIGRTLQVNHQTVINWVRAHKVAGLQGNRPTRWPCVNGD